MFEMHQYFKLIFAHVKLDEHILARMQTHPRIRTDMH